MARGGSPCGGSWTALTAGLTNNAIFALAIDPVTPATLYPGTFAGVFKSANAGESWTAVNAGLTNTVVRALAIDPSGPATLYAGTAGGGVFKSTNSGASWTAMNAGLTISLSPLWPSIHRRPPGSTPAPTAASTSTFKPRALCPGSNHSLPERRPIQGHN